MTVDFSIDDTDIYIENEKEFSEQEAITNLLEWKRCNTTTTIEDTQKGLLPQFLNISWEKTDTYFENGIYVVSRDYFETCLHINGIVNNLCINEERGKFFKEKMKDAYDNYVVQPFLLFINKVHIAWSRVTVVKSDSRITLLISDMDKDLLVEDVQILSIPFKIIYTEDEDELPTKKMIYRFNKNGEYSYDASILVYSDNTDIQTRFYANDKYEYYDMDIPYDRKITPNNLILFNENGKLQLDMSIDIKNTNLLTIEDRYNKTKYVTCCYSIESNLNEANTTRVGNIQFEKQLIDGSIVFTPLNKTEFQTSFDFIHDKTIQYDQNITNSLDYVFGYDENKLDKVFEDIRPVNIVQYDMDEIYKRHMSSADGSITMLKDIYTGMGLDTFPIIFHNGMVPEYYSKIKYTQTSFTFNTNEFNGKDTFEIVYFKNINNTLIKLDLVNKGDSNYLNIKDYYIPREDIVVYSACRGESNLFPINFNIDSIGNIVLENPRYLEGQLYIGPRNQFIYERFSPTSDTTHITLSDNFRTAYNSKKFMVFVNGRYLNSIFYRVLIPSINNGKITTRAIYTTKNLKPTDRVDVFYCAVPKMSNIDINGDLLIHCIKTKSTVNGQYRFKVPYPFKNYPREYDSFFCIKNSTYVDKSRYIIIGDYIEFIYEEDHFNLARDLVFVFPHYKPSMLTDSEVDPDSILGFISRYSRVSENTNTVVFLSDYYGCVLNKSMIHLFIHTTFIDPAVYEVMDNNTIRFTDRVIPKDTMVTMVIETDDNSCIHNNINLEVIPVVATEDNQYIFDIPKPECCDSFFILMGSVLVNPDRYFIVDDSKVLFVSSSDSISKGKKLLFVFAKDKKDPPDNVMYVKTEFIQLRPEEDCTSIILPANCYHRFKFNRENVLVFINSTYIRSDRFTITDNVLTLGNGEVFLANKNIIILFAYKDYKKVDYELKCREHIKFQDVNIRITINNQKKFTVPHPISPFTDTAFIVSIGSTMLNPESYTVSADNTEITLQDVSNVIKGRDLIFTFVHNEGFTYISKKQVSVEVSVGQTEIDIPSPYYRSVNLNNRMILTYGNVYIDTERYIIDSKLRKIILIDFGIKTPGRAITFTFFFTGNNYNGAVAYLPQSGYVNLIKGETINNVNKEMYLMFINGRKVCKSELLDISNNLIKVSTDIKRRHDLVLLNCSPTISELKGRYTATSKWNKTIDSFPI